MFETPVLIAFAVTLAAGLATALGSIVLFRASTGNPRLLAAGLAFAAGAMIFVSLVEIFGKSQKAFGEVYGEKGGMTGAMIAFFAGVLLVILLDRLVPNPHRGLDAPDDGADAAKIGRVAMLAAIAITAHNFPEGLATFFATLDSPAVGAPLAIAIAIHNIPEGVSIAVPVYYATGSKTKATLAAAASGVAEPIGALLGYLILQPVMSPFVYGSVFGIVAGVMVFLSLDELLPQAKRYAKGHETVYGMVLGMGLVAISLVLFKV
jgi:zinc transporter, ZIP family